MLAKTLWVMHIGVFVLLLAFMEVPEGLFLISAVGLYIAVQLFVVAFTFALAIMFRSRPPISVRVNPIAAIWLFLFEWVTWLILYSVLFPLEPWLNGKFMRRTNNEDQYPVLLIHGFLCNAGFWWSFKRNLHRIGVTNLYTINLEPLFEDIDALADQVAERVGTILQATGKRQLILITHSMGGLAARAYLRHRGAEERIAKLVTLGTPHHGTQLARFMLGTNVRQMRPESAWLQKLNAEDPLAKSLPMTSIYTCYDNIVSPQDSAVLEGTKIMPLAGPGHLSMAFSKTIQRLVCDEIRNTANEGRPGLRP